MKSSTRTTGGRKEQTSISVSEQSRVDTWSGGKDPWSLSKERSSAGSNMAATPEDFIKKFGGKAETLEEKAMSFVERYGKGKESRGLEVPSSWTEPAEEFKGVGDDSDDRGRPVVPE